MNLGVLYSGGKDSNLAMIKAVEAGHNISVLLNVVSENPDSYMFHTPLKSMVSVQSECLGIPLISVRTTGKKEEEVKDMEKLFIKGIEEFGIKGIVTGAVKSVYQSERIQRVAKSLGLWVFNPLWLCDEKKVALEASEKMNVIISGVAGYPLTEDYPGRRLSPEMIDEFEKMRISPSGEGGEFETFVLDSPMFKKRIEILEFEKEWKNWNGRITNLKYEVVEK